MAESSIDSAYSETKEGFVKLDDSGVNVVEVWRKL